MIHYGQHHIDEADIQAVVDVLRSSALTQGPMVEAFEKAVAQYVGVKYAVAVSNATAGLHLAALAAGAAPGTVLITSPITFCASANAGLYAGARTEFVDVDPKTVNMAPHRLEEALAKHPNTRVVIPVHFSGLPCDMPAIKALADRAGANVIEDAAHAFGGSYPSGEKIGSCIHSLMTVFSFHPVKAIAAGEGGMITTNDERIYRLLLRLRSHGITKLDDPFQLTEQSESAGIRNPWYYEMQELGYNYRLTDIQCALGLSQFQKLDAFVARRRTLVKAYDTAFAGFKNLRPAQSEGRDLSGHHLYVVRINFDALGTTRAKLMLALREKGVGTQVHYIPVPALPVYRTLGHAPDAYPNAASYYAEALTIPLYYDLTDAQQDFVVATLRELVA